MIAVAPPRRRGQVLVLMVPLMLVFLGLGALVVDLGLMRTTQARMTSACDTAADEAIRWRDQTPGHLQPDATPPTASDRDANRRSATVLLLDELFATSDAGPAFNHASEGNAQSVVTAADPYRPQLATNDANRADGDIVAGSYDAAATSHAEAADYTRPDFAPAGPAASADAPAVLARLRRVQGGSELPTATVSTIGPPLPLLFAGGTDIAATSGRYSARRDGLTVRAAAISTAAPAVAAMPVSAGSPLPGAKPVAISAAYWATLAPRASDGTTSPRSIVVTDGHTLLAGTRPVGLLLHALPVTAAGWVSIGTGFDPLDQPSATDPVLTTPTEGYFPLYSDGTPQRIVAFGYGRWEPSGTGGTLAKLSSVAVDGSDKGFVAPINATANLAAAWPTLAGLSDDDRRAVMSANAQAAGIVKAPQAVRAIGN